MSKRTSATPPTATAMAMATTTAGGENFRPTIECLLTMPVMVTNCVMALSRVKLQSSSDRASNEMRSCLPVIRMFQPQGPPGRTELSLSSAMKRVFVCVTRRGKRRSQSIYRWVYPKSLISAHYANWTQYNFV